MRDYVPSNEAKTLPLEDIALELRTSLQHGLSVAEALRRIEHFGKNLLQEDDSESLFSKFLDQFKEPMILMLLGSALVSCLVGAFSDAASIILAVLIVCSVGFIQEYRSDQALDALKDLVTHHAKVIRDGQLANINAAELCIGDLVEMSVGDRVPADVRIIDQVRFTTNESIFTGEVKPSKKQAESVIGQIRSSKRRLSFSAPNIMSNKELMEAATHVSDCPNIAFQGTLVSSGSARGIVIATSQNTELGRIHSILKSLDEGQTPLQESMEKLAQQISILSIGIIILIFFIGIFTNKSMLEMFTMGISLAVAAIPEGLPIVVTVTLAMGVMRMTKKNVIIRKLPSVEALGAVNVVCVDKTGTLTQNEMTVTTIFAPGRSLENYVQTTGVGYQTNGGGLYNHPINEYGSKNLRGERLNVFKPGEEALRLLLTIGTVCNNAILTDDGSLIGLPTEGALITAAAKAGLDREKFNWKRLSEIPFSSIHKFMAVEVENVEMNRKPVFFVKGAPEILLGKCKRYYINDENTPILTENILDSIRSMSDRFGDSSLRVMGLAYGSHFDENSNNNDLVFVGIVGIYDPPRIGVENSIKQLHNAHVKVVMITGDSRKTAISIAKELGIIPQVHHSDSLDIQLIDYRRDTSDPDAKYVMSPEDLSHVEDFMNNLANIRVFYRMTPLHKMKIVEAYKRAGFIVAMTGDGVNDAPALKLSNIGISMGKSGSDVSKESSDMILVDDQFSSIEAAIEEGKSIFNNIKNFLRYQLTTSVSCIGIIIYCTIFGYPLPLNPMQILWINIIMDGPPAQSLGVEPVDEDVMKKPPRGTKKSIISPQMIFSVIINALIMIIGTLYVFIKELNEDGVVNSRDTSMVFTTLVLFQAFNALNCRSECKSVFSIGLFSNKAFVFAVGGSILGQLAMLYLPFMQFIFETEAISLSDWGLILSITSTVWILEEILKFLRRYGN